MPGLICCGRPLEFIDLPLSISGRKLQQAACYGCHDTFQRRTSESPIYLLKTTRGVVTAECTECGSEAFFLSSTVRIIMPGSSRNLDEKIPYCPRCDAEQARNANLVGDPNLANILEALTRQFPR